MGFREELLRLTNAERRSRGRKPLSLSPQLNRAAQFHAADMAQRNYFSHDSLDGTPWYKRIKRFLVKRNVGIAENIAFGQDTASEVFKDWMASPGHRANILSKSMRKMGVGRATRGSKEYWVVDFGAF